MYTIKINEQIASLRKHKGMTQEELAAELGVTNQSVSKWESAQCCPDIILLPKLAELFGVSVDELLGGTLCSEKKELEEGDIVSILQRKLDTLPEKEAHAFAFETAAAMHTVLFGRALHAGGNPGWNTEENIRHACAGEWGYSAFDVSGFTTIMRHGTVLFSNNRDLGMQSEQLGRITNLLGVFGRPKNLKTVVALYRATVEDEEMYADLEQICDGNGLDQETVRECLQGELAPYLVEKDQAGRTVYRLSGMYMSMVPVLSLIDYCG